jgi:hypothetical protein
MRKKKEIIVLFVQRKRNKTNQDDFYSTGNNVDSTYELLFLFIENSISQNNSKHDASPFSLEIASKEIRLILFLIVSYAKIECRCFPIQCITQATAMHNVHYIDCSACCYSFKFLFYFMYSMMKLVGIIICY